MRLRIPTDGRSHANRQGASQKIANYQPSENLFKKFSNKINVEKYEGPDLPNHAANFLSEARRKMDSQR
jgi:RIO kinase 1